MRPSFLGLVITGFMTLFAVILIIMYYDTLKKAELIYIVLLLSISIGIHSLLHANEEIYFNFNPLTGQWKPHDRALANIKI